MGIRRAFADFAELRRSLAELFANDCSAEEHARYQLAVSARRFSRQTQEVVDDKLSFSATLMRAGEVQAANRLLEEFERDVRTEEAALIETVNEVKVAESMRRERMTRLRLARTLAVALMGASLLTFSAFGMAVAGFLKDRSQAEREQNLLAPVQAAVRGDLESEDSGIERKRLRRLRIGDVRLVLTKAQFDRLKKLTTGAIAEGDLQYLLSALPSELASKLQEAMTIAQSGAERASSTLEKVAAPEIKLVEKKKRKAAKAAEPSPEPTDPAEEPTDEPKDDGGDGNGGQKEGDAGDDEEDGDEDGTGPVPLDP